MTDLSNLQLFITQPHRCSYIEDKNSTTVFVDPKADIDQSLYSELSEFGFRRSGGHIYRPQCEKCQACVPIRIPVELFHPTRSQKRCSKRNQDLTITVSKKISIDEHYGLYERYIKERHSDGDMYPPTEEQFLDFLSAQWGLTRYIEFRDESKTLIGVAVVDMLSQGISAMYTFFCPDQAQRSLGSYAILHQIEWAKELHLPYVYLGYWIRQCQKMSYKVDYRPFQLLVNNDWMTFS